VDFLTRALGGEQQPLKRLDPLAALPDRRLLREGTAAYAAATSAVSEEGSRVVRRTTMRPSNRAPKLPPLRVTVVNGDLRDARLLAETRSLELTIYPLILARYSELHRPH
jgi:hypothetical protein